MIPDALVVGAGPAGSIAALLLARAGLRVRIIDRCTFPRHKLCGDTINPGSMSILRSLDETEPATDTGPRGLRIHDCVRAASLPIEGMLVTGPGGTAVGARYPHGARGAAILRCDLDQLLLERAIDAGAVFEPGLIARAPLMDDVAAGTGAGGGDRRVIGVRSVTHGREHVLRARIVIAADGRASRLARVLGLARFASRPRRWACGAYFTDVADVRDRGEMHVRAGAYLGIAPLPGGMVNVCVVHDARAPRRRTPEDAHDASAMIGDMVRADRMLRERFANARQISEGATLGPLAVESAVAGCPGLLLAGDAAGFVDPMTGDGLRFAMRGGIIAATAALTELASGHPSFRTVTDAHRREFRRKRVVNRMIRTLVSSPHGVGLATRIAGLWDAPVRYLIGVAGDVGLALAPQRPPC